MNLILGGTHGLGFEIAKVLQEAGQRTFVIGRSYDETKHGDGMRADVSTSDGVDRVRAYLSDIQNPELSAFYWVAGYGYVGDFAKQPEPQKMALVNFANILPIAQIVWRKLLQSEQAAHFVVISSTTGQKARKNEAVYAATKHAQVGFARSLGLESERLVTNIKVALFMPGGMQTPFWEGSEPTSFGEFLVASKVAQIVCNKVLHQQSSFYEETIERGSL